MASRGTGIVAYSDDWNVAPLSSHCPHLPVAARRHRL